MPNSINSIRDSNASLEKPQKIGQYCLINDKQTGKREAIFDNLKLSYLHLPPKNEPFSFDLNESYQKYRHINWCSAANVKLDEFLEWIVHNKAKFDVNQLKPLGTDFVTYRGALTKLMVTPFQRDKWLIGGKLTLMQITKININFLFWYLKSNKPPNSKGPFICVLTTKMKTLARMETCLVLEDWGSRITLPEALLARSNVNLSLRKNMNIRS